MARPERRSNQERREQSTEQVLAAALKQFVTRGYHSTSIDDIARAAGLTKGAVYFYFKGKSALLLELLSFSLLIGKYSCRILFVESICRSFRLSVAGLLLLPFADRTVVQWEGLTKKYNRTQCVGFLS